MASNVFAGVLGLLTFSDQGLVSFALLARFPSEALAGLSIRGVRQLWWLFNAFVDHQSTFTQHIVGDLALNLMRQFGPETDLGSVLVQIVAALDIEIGKSEEEIEVAARL
ncbi:MAG: hypothetical protein U0744_12390 [Gemmataceae bacterium]